MGKVFNCNAGTPYAARNSLDSILSLDDVQGVLRMMSNLKGKIYNVSVDIKNEMGSNRGLSLYALCIGGESPAYQQASNICNKIDDFISEIESVCSKIENDARTQRKKEGKELVDAINAAIAERNNRISSLKGEVNSLEAMSYSTVRPDVGISFSIRISRLNEQISILEDEIIEYQEIRKKATSVAAGAE